MTDRELMQQALEALEEWADWVDHSPPKTTAAIITLRERLAQPEQEPVAWIDEIIDDSEMIKELAEQAHCYACEYAQRPDYNPHNPYNQLIYKKRYDSKFAELIVRNRALQALAQPEQEPVAWRDHVEQRLLTWRQSFVNRSGDQLALDDFMDKQSLNDLIDFVCSEYTAPPQRKPLTDEEIDKITEQLDETTIGWSTHEFARAIEAAHGIKEKNA